MTASVTARSLVEAAVVKTQNAAAYAADAANGNKAKRFIGHQWTQLSQVRPAFGHAAAEAGVETVSNLVKLVLRVVLTVGAYLTAGLTLDKAATGQSTKAAKDATVDSLRDLVRALAGVVWPGFAVPKAAASSDATTAPASA